MRQPVRFGLVGCGMIARVHAEALVSLPETELTAVCDIDRAKAEKFAATFDLEHVYGSCEEMLDAVNVDAVSVTTDHKHHYGPTMAAIDRGVAAIVEKPITASLVEGESLVRAAEERGVLLGGIFQRRFFPAALRMREAIEQGRLGQLTLAEVVAHLGRDEAYFAADSWRGTWKGEGGGVLTNQAVHMIDMLLWMMGDPVEVYGRWGKLMHGDYIDVEDTAAAVVKFHNGALATIQATTTFQRAGRLSPEGVNPPSPVDREPPGFRLAVHGTSGHTVGLLEYPELTQAVTDQWTFPGEDGQMKEWHADESDRPGFPGFHSDQLRNFAIAVAEGNQPLVTGRQALAALEVVKAVYLSESTGRPVKLPMSAEVRQQADAITEGSD